MKLLPKVFPTKNIAFQNVVSKRLTFHYTEMEEHFQEFITSIIEQNYHLKGPYFYSLNNVPTDELIDIQMFFPIVEDTFDVPGYQFATYFEINQLIKTVVIGDFERNTEQAYWHLIATLEENNFNIATPFYHVFPLRESKYMHLYLGYSKELAD